MFMKGKFARNGSKHMRLTSMRIPTLICSILLCGLTPAASAAYELEVAYVDGIVEVRSETGWRELLIGDRLSEEAWVRLEAGALAELTLTGDASARGVTVSLSKAGEYSIGNLVDLSRVQASQGIDRHLSGLLESALGDHARETGTVMGVRGEEQGAPEDPWADELEREMLLAALELLAEERYGEALPLLQELLAIVGTSAEPEVRFYTGYTHALLDQPMRALAQLRRILFKPGHALYPDHVLLMARLLVESLAYEEALAWLDAHPLDTEDPAPLQAALFLRALTYRGMEDDEAYRHALVQIIQLDPDTETGLLANQLLESM